MAQDISKKTLAVLLVVAVVLSASVTLLSLSSQSPIKGGNNAATGTVSLRVQGPEDVVTADETANVKLNVVNEN